MSLIEAHFDGNVFNDATYTREWYADGELTKQLLEVYDENLNLVEDAPLLDHQVPLEG